MNNILRYSFFGILITAVLLIVSSIPPTRNFSNNYLFSIQLFEPASESVINSYSKYSGAMRGRSFVGVSILSAAFVNSIWPMLLLLRKTIKKNSIGQIFMLMGFIMLPASVIFTYSRGAIIGVVLVSFGILLFNSGNSRNMILASLFMGVLIFLYIGVDSKYFYFKRLEQSTARVIDQPVQKRNETERLYAYIEPFWHIAEHPQYLILGEGITHQQQAASRAIFSGNRADHAVFARSYYAYGLLAAFFYVGLLIFGLIYTFNNAVFSRNPYVLRISRVLVPTLLGLLPWFILGHAAVSTPRGATLFIFVLALVSMQSTIKPLEVLREEHKRRTLNENAG
ncbi:MAG: O-antigen ligase family protein [Bacteroidia bacterium]